MYIVFDAPSLPSCFSILSSLRKNYQLRFIPSSLNLISAGPSVLPHFFLSHFLTRCNVSLLPLCIIYYFTQLIPPWITLLLFPFTRANTASPLYASLCFIFLGTTHTKYFGQVFPIKKAMPLTLESFWLPLFFFLSGQSIWKESPVFTSSSQ